MPITSPTSIWFSDTSTPMDINAITATMATSIEAAFTNTRQQRTYKWADSTARANQLGMTQGDTGYQIDNNATYVYNGSVWVPNNPGEVLVIPTGIAGSGSISPLGQVTFTNSTGVSVNGCFTSTFENYRIVVSIRAKSAASNVGMLLRASGVDSTTGYTVQRIYSTGATTVSNSIGPSGSWELEAGTQAVSNMTVVAYSPAIPASTTRIFSNAVSTPSMFITNTGGYHSMAASYDGFSLSTAGSGGGTITGTIRVYGSNNG